MAEQVSINLASDITYVSGTVNGEVANFTLASEGVWSAIVPRAEDGKYVISVTAYNNIGTATTYSTILYKLEDMLEPKINWTSDDYYNAEDLNRVEINTQFLSDYLKSLEYVTQLEPVVTDRDKLSIDFTKDINKVERNIDRIRSVFITPPNYEGMKNWELGDGFDFRDANRLERNLKLLYQWALALPESFKYCGTFSSGEEVI